MGGVPNWTSNWTCKWKWQLGSGVQGEVLGRVINLGVVSIELTRRSAQGVSVAEERREGEGGESEP